MNSYNIDLKPRLPKTLVTYFFLVHACSGLDFGFRKLFSKQFNLVAKFYGLLFPGVTFLLSMYYFLLRPMIYMFIINIFEMICYIIALFFTKHTLYDFFIEFAIVEKDFHTIKHKKYIGAKVIISTLITFFVQFGCTTLFCLYTVTLGYCSMFNTVHYIYFALLIVYPDIPLVVQFLIMYTVYDNIKSLKTALTSNEVEMKLVLKKYIEIADAVDKIKPMFDNLFLIGLVINFPKGMFVTYNSLQFFKTFRDWLTFLVQYSYAVHVAIMLCLPAVMAELVSKQSDTIKLILHNRLVNETDKRTRREIKRFLRYMYGRPFEYKVWRIIPVDHRLPVSLFSMNVTYLIVIIQFTHLFD